MMTMAEGFAVYISRIPKADLTLAMIETLEFLHDLFVPSRRLSEEILTPLPSNPMLFFTNETLHRFLITQKGCNCGLM